MADRIAPCFESPSAAALQAAIPTPAPVPPPAPATVTIVLTTSLGRIVIALEKDRAPITTANFLRYVDQRRLDGITFYRTVKVQPDFGFVQFGVQNAVRRLLPPIRHEPTTLTGVPPHRRRHLPDPRRTGPPAPATSRSWSATSGPSLDADPSKPGDNAGYAAFGHVVEGMDVVKRILDQPVAVGGYFRGEQIATPVVITSARRAVAPPVARPTP